MNKKWLAALLAIAVAPIIWGRTLGDEAAMGSLGSRGTVDATNGALVNIPGLIGTSRVTHAIIVANDDTTNNLLVATDVLGSTAVEIPTPGFVITVMTKVVVLLPGEKLSLDQGAQSVGLRAEAGTCAARLIVTKR